jgi:phage gp36-like protein
MYATTDQFRSKYFDVITDILQNIDSSRSVSDDTAIVTALESATGEIDTILGVRYIIPIFPISDYLVDACRTIARKNLDYDSNDAVRLAYEDVIGRLEEIRDGNGVLPPVGGISPPLNPDLGQTSRRKIVPSQFIGTRTSSPEINFRGTLPRRLFTS